MDSSSSFSALARRASYSCDDSSAKEACQQKREGSWRQRRALEPGAPGTGSPEDLSTSCRASGVQEGAETLTLAREVEPAKDWKQLLL